MDNFLAMRTNCVCRMHKPIYGLGQASRTWFEKFTSRLLELDFIGSHAYTSFFIRLDRETFTYPLIFVDDIVLTGKNSSFFTQLIHQLSRQFSMKGLGPISYFLGIEVKVTQLF